MLGVLFNTIVSMAHIFLVISVVYVVTRVDTEGQKVYGDEYKEMRLFSLIILCVFEFIVLVIHNLV